MQASGITRPGGSHLLPNFLAPPDKGDMPALSLHLYPAGGGTATAREPIPIRESPDGEASGTHNFQLHSQAWKVCLRAILQPTRFLLSVHWKESGRDWKGSSDRPSSHERTSYLQTQAGGHRGGSLFSGTIRARGWMHLPNVLWSNQGLWTSGALLDPPCLRVYHLPQTQAGGCNWH